MSFLTVSKVACIVGAIVSITLVVAGDMTAQRKPDFTEVLKVARVSAPLTKEERALAVKLAEQAMRSNRLLTARKMYLTEVRIHRDAASEKRSVFERLAVLTYYRYEGNLSIQVFLNLARQRVLGVKQLQNYSPPLSVEELNLAKELAFNDPQLKGELAPYRYRLVVEGLASRSASPQDPLFRHRIIFLLFRVGQRYLVRQWMVFVDLTTEKVILRPVPPKMKM